MQATKVVLERLRQLPLTVQQLLSSGASSEEAVSVSGWIKSVRQQKRVAFVSLSDGSCLRPLQAVCKPDQALSLSAGQAVKMVGRLQASKGAEQAQELQVESVQLLGACPADYPIQKKEHTNAFLRKFPHLRVRTDALGSMLRVRDICHSSVSTFLRENGIRSVEAPILTSSDCEGGSSVFRVEASSSWPPSPKTFFDSPTYLTVSSQLYLEALSAALGRVYTLGPAFRAEPSLTSRHLAEFWMLEAELSFVNDLDALLAVVEGSVRAAWHGAFSACPDEMHHFNRKPEQLSEQAWPRITYDKAVSLLQQHHSPRLDWGADLNTEQERWLAEQHFSSPVFITDYPTSLKPFYMRRNADGRTVACFDLLVPGVGELAGGSLREERLDVLQQAMQAKHLDPQDYDWYLDLRRFGSVQHGGFGLGWERLISWLTGAENVRECVAFPRAKEGFKV